MIKSALNWFDGLVEKCKRYDYLALLAIRLYLIPVILLALALRCWVSLAPSRGLARPPQMVV